MKQLIHLLVWLVTFCSSVASAEVIVLIHGFDSDEYNWYKKGIAAQLEKAGYRDGGSVHDTPDGLQGPRLDLPGSIEDTFFALSVPDKTPLQVQAKILRNTLKDLSEHQGAQRFTLIGHSAGGIVARLVMVNNPEVHIDRLITIATPHGGSRMAQIGDLFNRSPFGKIADIGGLDTLSDAQLLLKQLKPQRNNDFLFRLNQAPHPEADYLSIVHTRDKIVPALSQDMDIVPALKGRSGLITIPEGHGLSFADGVAVGQYLTEHR